MPGRKYTAGSGYRYGFNGKEKDNETKEVGNSYDFGARIYDPRLGRWSSLDPLMKKYPSLSPYNFCANNPAIFIDVDGKDFLLSVVYTYNGKATPTVVHELGNTSINATSPLTLIYNHDTKEFDFTLNINVQFSSNFTGDMNNKGGGSLEQNNPGLYREVKGHEDGHAGQNFDAARKNISITLNIGGKNITYSGRPDQVLTKAFNEFDVKLKAETQIKIDNGDFASQKDVDTYLQTETDKFMKSATDKVVKKIFDNIKNGMNPKTKDLEADANKRAAKNLGEKTIKYNNGKTKIKSNKGTGTALSY